MWVKKISTSATAMACAACIATAATLPVMGEAAEQLAKKISSADVRLSVDFSALDAFNAIPLYLQLFSSDPDARAEAIAGLDLINGIPALLALINGNLDLLLEDETNPGYAALSALDVFFGDGADEEGGVISDGNFDGLANYDALSALPAYRTLLDPTSTDQDRLDALGELDSVSAIPVFVAVANAATPQEAADALADYDALSAIPVFFGSEGVFTSSEGIDALAGYDALSAVPVFVGTDGVFTGGGLAALAPNADGDGGYDALSAIPPYLDIPPQPAPTSLASERSAAPEVTSGSTTPTTGSNPLKSFVSAVTPSLPQVFTPPAPVVEEKVTTPTDKSGPSFNLVRDSQKFTPESIGDSPILFGSGKGADNGIRGWGEALNKLGIGGEDSSSGAE